MAQGTTPFDRFLRRAEWLGVAAGVLVLSGAIFPLLLSEPDGSLTDAARSQLRLLSLPAYSFSLLLVAVRPAPILRAAQRNVPLFVLILLPLISILWSIGPSITLRRAIALVMSMAVAYVLATRFTPRRQVVVLGVVLGGATLLSILAGVVMPGLAFMPGEGALRGVFIHKNVLGWISCFTVAVGLAARTDPSRRMRRGGLLLVLSGAAGVLLSTSATSLLAALTAAATFRVVPAITRRRGIERLAMVFGLMVLTVLLIGGLALSYGAILEALGKDPTLTGRVQLWQSVDPEIARRPVLGFGYGAFWSEGNATAWRIWEALGWQAPHAHNGYRDLMLGVGLVGLVLFVIVTARGLSQGLALCTEAPGEAWTLPVSFITISLVLNLTESTILMQNDLMWVLFATAVVGISYRHAELRQGLPRQIRLAITAT